MSMCLTQHLRVSVLHVYSYAFLDFLDVGIFDDDFIEERKKGLEEFINKSVYDCTIMYCRLFVHTVL